MRIERRDGTQSAPDRIILPGIGNHDVKRRSLVACHGVGIALLREDECKRLGRCIGGFFCRSACARRFAFDFGFSFGRCADTRRFAFGFGRCADTWRVGDRFGRSACTCLFGRRRSCPFRLRFGRSADTRRFAFDFGRCADTRRVGGRFGRSACTCRFGGCKRISTCLLLGRLIFSRAGCKREDQKTGKD